MEKFFNQRNKKITNLNLLADKLGHTLRENVSLFSVDDSENIATFVTESGNIIEGNYYFTDRAILDNIVVESGEVFSDEEKFDSSSKNQISLLIESIYDEELSNSGDILESIIDSWTQRVKFNNTVDRLREKSESFNNTFNILGTQEFERFVEISENISKFVSENKDTIISVPEIRNAIKLSDTVSKAFNLERKSLEQLSEEKSIEFSLGESVDLYEMICKQELMKKEILESKKSFDTVWATEKSISNLATKIFEDDESVIKQALVEAFVEIPYISLISKKQLSNTIFKNLTTLHEEVSFSKNELKEFTQTLFEMKKPLRSLTSNLLQEKYGINLNNIKEVPTFKTLLNTQSIIFESLAKVAPRGSVIKESLLSLSEMLKSKNGVQAIDVNNGLRYLFENSGFAELYEEESISSTFNLSESVEEDNDAVALIMEELYGEAIAVTDKQDKEIEEQPEEEKSEVESDAPDKMSTKELMNTLNDLEQLIGEPADLSEE
jgi:hypothetical protein